MTPDVYNDSRQRRSEFINQIARTKSSGVQKSEWENKMKR
jgi:hypothetical protein